MSTPDAKPLQFHLDRLQATTRTLWRAHDIDLHMCDGTVKRGQYGLLQDLREDIARLRIALDAVTPTHPGAT